MAEKTRAQLMAEIAALKAQLSDVAPSWISKPAAYATEAQLEQYEKMVEIAKATRDEIAKAAGTETVKAFIPISKTQTAMPHTISWSVSYSK